VNDIPHVADLEQVDLSSLTREQLVEVLQAQREAGIKISFSGKANAGSLARRVRPRTLREVKKYGAGQEEERVRNLVIEGDNLQAMATLYRDHGQVDLILADPPYNTGQTSGTTIDGRPIPTTRV
jgi:adenine-specific DNA-methyltransferase